MLANVRLAVAKGKGCGEMSDPESAAPAYLISTEDGTLSMDRLG
jgi:hypothetical protein